MRPYPSSGERRGRSSCALGVAPRGPRRVAFRLGLTSFGGPIAHLGYFRREYVERRRWLDETAYADFVALSQLLPGPASSQVGILIGTRRAGMGGGIAAWLGFTLPSAITMVLFALIARNGDLSSAGWVEGLKIAAVAIVAQAVYLMARALTPDWPRRLVAVLAAVVALAWTTPFAQVAIIAAGALIGRFAVGTSDRVADRPGAEPDLPSRRCGVSDGVRRAVGRPPAAGGGSAGNRWRCSRRSTGAAPSSSGAGMSSCRCSTRRSSIRAGSRTTSSSPDTGPRRPSRDRSSPSRPIWARCPDRRRTASPARRSPWSRSSCRHSC